MNDFRCGLTSKQIGIAFNIFDRDGNGYLGASDVSKVYRVLGENLDDDLVHFFCLTIFFID
jgi:Ca2+-binding EF-hand superfamily protein